MARLTPPPGAPAPPEPASALAPAPDTPALDLAGGMARLMGDRALFARVLARFGSEYRQAASAIRNALGNGDTPLALRLVHTLKGAAGIIEAVPLSREAQALERVLRHPPPTGADADVGTDADAGDPWQRLARLEQALDRVLLELDAVTAATASVTASATGSATGSVSAAARTAPDAGEAPAQAADPTHTVWRLAALLDEGNGEAVDLVHEAAAALTTQLGEQRYSQLVDRIEAFDFDAALALLAKWA